MPNVFADSCPMFGDPGNSGSLAYYMQYILDIAKYIGIVLCVVLTIVDIAKYVIGDDKADTAPLIKKALSRIIAAVLLFFVPTIVKLLMSLIGAYGTCGLK